MCVVAGTLATMGEERKGAVGLRRRDMLHNETMDDVPQRCTD